MSEKEKKAIENVKRMFEDITIEELLKDKNFNITIYSLGILDILRVIAIVDKQQKEIEKLKQEMEERLIGREEITKYEMGYEIENNYISKDKIREKIKEYKTTLNQNIFTKLQVIEHGFPKENVIQIMIKAKVEILKELLGGENE